MYNTKYILGFTNDLNELYEIYFDVLDYVGDPIQLTGTDDVLTIRSTAGDENKLEPILGTEALINIFVDETTPITIADLVAQHDNDIRVTVYRDEDYTKAVYQGFIVVEDNSQPFLDPPFILSVRALDGLGLLKNVDLADLNNLRFAGTYSIVEWITQILYKTGQTMNLRVYFNFYHASFTPNVGALEQTYLNAITFSQGDAFNPTTSDPTVDINATDADDCYTALEKIVRCFRCRLFQEDGVWNLVGLYEYLTGDGSSYTEYAFGTPVGGFVPVTAMGNGMSIDYSLQIGKNEIMHPVQDDQILYLKLATKWIKLTYTYDQSQNKVCNQDLADISQDDRNPAFDSVISSSIIDPSIAPVVNLTCEGYDPYCFDHFDGSIVSALYQAYPQQTPSSNAFVRQALDPLGYEMQKFIVLGVPSAGRIACIRTKRILIDVGDILQLSFSWRYENGAASNVRWPVAFVYLYGDDGSHWSLSSVGDGSVALNPVTWRLADANFHEPGSSGSQMVQSDFISDVRQWNSLSVNSTHLSNEPFASVPVSGQIEVIFMYPNLGEGNEMWVKDISITILPFLQGAYQQLKGDYNYSASNNNIKQTESDDVQISDSPKRYFKGALLKANSDLLPPTWGRVGIAESFRFTELMETVMYNHLYRIVQKVEGTFRGLVYMPAQDSSTLRPNGFLNSYSFADGDVPTKRFMLTSFEKYYGTGQWRAVVVETLADQNADGFLLPDAYQFSYIFQ